MKRLNSAFLLGSILACAAALTSPAQARGAVRDIVLIAGQKSHGPGEHDYLRAAKLIKALLDRAPNAHGLRTEIYFNGWPDDPVALARADTIVILSDGEDRTGPKMFHAPFMTQERMAALEREMRRGCGLLTFHFATFSSAEYAPQILAWTGAYFDMASGHDEGGFYAVPNDPPHARWHSAIRVMEADVDVCAPGHPVANGVSSFHMKDEFYYQLTFRHDDPRVTPILRVPALSPLPESQIVAWALQRTDGGRGFGFTPGHYLDNWHNNNFRKLVLNAVVWTAGMAVPPGGVASAYLNEDQVNTALMTEPISTLIARTGSLGAGEWSRASSAIAHALNSETPRFAIRVAEGPEALAAPLSTYRLVVLCDGDGARPELPSAARENLNRYVAGGGGLTVAYVRPAMPPAASEPAASAAPSDGPAKTIEWHSPAPQDRLPVYGNLSLFDVRRLSPNRQQGITEALHRLPADGQAAIKRELAGTMYSVAITDPEHPSAQNVVAYKASRSETADDYDFALPVPGDIHVIATVRPHGTEAPQPLAFTASIGEGRVYHLILGPWFAAVTAPKLVQLLRYGSLWAARN